MGSMDCLTTVVGTVFFGTKELNPLIANLVATNLPVFVAVKLIVTFSVGAIFVLTEKMLNRKTNTDDHSVRLAHKTLTVACIALIVFLSIVVLNNVLVLLRLL